MADLYEAVIYEESRGKPLARSVAGAVGLMQITPAALADWNRYNKEQYTMDDMYDAGINRKVGVWYLSKRIPQMLRAYNIPDTLYNRLWAYHDGIGNVKKGYKSKAVKEGYIERIMRRMYEKKGVEE